MRDIVRHYASSTPGAAAPHPGRCQQPAAGKPISHVSSTRKAASSSTAFTSATRNRTRRRWPRICTRAPVPTRDRFTAVFRYLEPSADASRPTSPHCTSRCRQRQPEPEDARVAVQDPCARRLQPDRPRLRHADPSAGAVAGENPARQRRRPTSRPCTKPAPDVRLEVYDWLFKTSRKNAQDIRIQSPARSRSLRRPAGRLETAGLSVRQHHAVLRHRHRQLGRPPRRAGRTDEHPGQRRRARTDGEPHRPALRSQHALRHPPVDASRPRANA